MFLRLTLLCSLFLASVAAISAQENSLPKTISGGVLNGKATNLVKPEYPPAAKAVNASGAVNVQVVIGEDGSVISAEAVSGHPLLRAAAVEAARSSKFSPTTLSGTPVKITGVIVYNFSAGTPVISNTSGTGVEDSVTPGSNSTPGTGAMILTPQRPTSASTPWFLIGWNLSLLESSYVFKNSLASSPLLRLPADWTTEKGYVEQLSKLVGTEPRDKSAGEVARPERIENVSEINAIALSLRTSIEARVSGSASKTWLLGLGPKLVTLTVDPTFRAPGARDNAVTELRSFISNAPVDVPTNIVAELTTLADLIEKGSDSRESISAIGKQRGEVLKAAMTSDR